MKLLVFSLASAALVYAQAAGQNSAPPIAPGTPAVTGLGGGAPSPGAAAAPPIAPDTVVAEVNGKKYTAADLDKLIEMLPAQYQQAARSQPQMLSQVFLMQRLAADAEKEGLPDKSPYKEQLEMSRIQVLSTAELSNVNNTMKVAEEDEQKYYKDHPEKFKEVKTRVIYVAYGSGPSKANPSAPKAAEGKKLLTEAEAHAKIDDLAKQIKDGADFGKLARENSDDTQSAAKDGDFGAIRIDSPYPQPIKTAVFALMQGEVSAPIKQPNGYYLIRAEEITQKSYNDAFAQVVQSVRQEKFQEWLKALQSQYNVKVENQAYFTPRPQLQQVH